MFVSLFFPEPINLLFFILLSVLFIYLKCHSVVIDMLTSLFGMLSEILKAIFKIIAFIILVIIILYGLRALV